LQVYRDVFVLATTGGVSRSGALGVRIPVKVNAIPEGR